MSETINITFSEQQLVFIVNEDQTVAVPETTEQVSINLTEESLVFTITQEVLQFTITAGSSAEDANFGRIRLSATDPTHDWLGNKIDSIFNISNNTLCLSGITKESTDELKLDYYVRLKGIVFGQAELDTKIGINLSDTLFLTDESNSSYAISLFPTFDSSSSEAITANMEGISGYTITNMTNLAYGSNIAALNFGNVVGLYTTAGNDQLACRGLSTFACMSIYAGTTIKSAVGATVAGAILVGGAQNISSHVCSLCINRSSFSSCPIEKVTYIEKPGTTATNSYQMCLEGYGNRSGIFFSDTAIDAVVSGKPRLFADTSTTFSMAIGTSTKIKISSTQITLGAAYSDRVNFVAGGNATWTAGELAPVNNTTPVGYIAVTVESVLRYIPLLA